MQEIMGPGMLRFHHDADHGTEGSRELVSVSWEEAPNDVLWSKARRSCC